MIHGNHDDPGGESNLCAANLLEAWPLRIPEVCDVEGIMRNLCFPMSWAARLRGFPKGQLSLHQGKIF